MKGNNVETRRFAIAAEFYDWIPTEDGKGHRRANVRMETREVDVVVDFAAIACQLGKKAVKAKGGKAQEIGGLVTVFVVK